MNTPTHFFTGSATPSEINRHIANMSDDQKKMLHALGVNTNAQTRTKITHDKFL